MSLNQHEEGSPPWQVSAVHVLLLLLCVTQTLSPIICGENHIISELSLF